MEACDLAEKVLSSRSKGLGFDSQCLSCVEVSGKLLIAYFHGPRSMLVVMGTWRTRIVSE